MSETYTGDLRELVSEPGAVLEVERPVYTYCPVHEDTYRPSLAVYADHAFCYTCRAYLNRAQFSEHFTQEKLSWSKVLASRERIHKPRQVVDVAALADAAHNLLLRSPSKLEWLEQRGIDRDTVYRFLLGHNGPAYTLPVWAGGRTAGIRFRRDDEECPEGQSKYWGIVGSNDVMWYPNPPDNHEVLVLTEGEFDALLLRRYGIPAYSLTNGAQAWKKVDWVKLLKDKQGIVLCGDQDEPGSKAMGDLYDYLNAAVPHVWIQALTWSLTAGKDITDLWKFNPALFDGQIETIKGLLEVPR